MKNFKNLKEKVAEKVKLNKLRIQGFFVFLGRILYFCGKIHITMRLRPAAE